MNEEDIKKIWQERQAPQRVPFSTRFLNFGLIILGSVAWVHTVYLYIKKGEQM
jgi:hypothetical protein